MRLLVLGGTRFVSRGIVLAAVALGWEVTTFNRGLSGGDVAGVRVLRGDRTKADDLRRLAQAGPWDAVIDSSGYVPRVVLASCRRLEPVSGRCLFMSTVSVYRDWPVKRLSEQSEVLPCPMDAGPVSARRRRMAAALMGTSILK
jgi:2'-hydroxyisoflavone reductase